MSGGKMSGSLLIRIYTVVGMGVHFKCMMSCQVGTFTELFILNVKCGVTGVAWACYAPNFEKVQGAYCFGLVRLSVSSKLI